jgi:hypothetical protein
MYCLLSSVLFPLYHEANPPQESLVLPSIDAKVVRHPEDNGLFAILSGGSPLLVR